MIEERPPQMRGLAQKAAEDDLAEKEIQKINEERNNLEGQIELLN